MNKKYIQRATEIIDRLNVYEQISLIRLHGKSIERENIPEYNYWNECLHGVARAGVATVFPQAIGMASSWNTNLVEKVADAIATEGRAKYNEYRKVGLTKQYQGINMCTPNINIFRDPRWGRGQETYGEDPYLTGRMGTSFVKGLQGNGEYRKCGATLKHYAVHSGPEVGRHGFDVNIDKETMYDTYLRAFKMCIQEADPACIMGAYNSVYGVPCCASKLLLEDIARKQFGFQGYVMSDYSALSDIYLESGHHYVNTPEETCKVALEAGLDLDMGHVYDNLEKAYDEGIVSSDLIRTASIRVLASRIALGEFDKNEYDNIPYSKIDCEEHRALNLDIAHESIVLLKNDGILPLSKNTKVAVIGPNADSKDILIGNYNGNMSRYTTLLKGIQDKGGDNVTYAMGCPTIHVSNEDWDEQMEDEAMVVARHSDVIIMTMGIDPTLEGEENDSSTLGAGGDRNTIDLPPRQNALLKRLLTLGKPIVFVNVSGSAFNLSIQDETCNAVIQCFYPGARGGEALADILYGDYNPSAKLPITLYKTLDDLPAFTDYSMTNRTYRYYKGKPVYPFGYGLSYTTFAYSNATTNGDMVTITITNTGKCDGAEVVQCYSVYEDKNTLIDFTKVYLKRGESTTVTLKHDTLAPYCSVGSGLIGQRDSNAVRV